MHLFQGAPFTFKGLNRPFTSLSTFPESPHGKVCSSFVPDQHLCLLSPLSLASCNIHDNHVELFRGLCITHFVGPLSGHKGVYLCGFERVMWSALRLESSSAGHRCLKRLHSHSGHQSCPLVPKKARSSAVLQEIRQSSDGCITNGRGGLRGKTTTENEVEQNEWILGFDSKDQDSIWMEHLCLHGPVHWVLDHQSASGV